jgi:IS30 family transposase
MLLAGNKLGRRHSLNKQLPRAKPKRGHRAQRGTKSLIPKRISIHERPLSIALREEFGHKSIERPRRDLPPKSAEAGLFRRRFR